MIIMYNESNIAWRHASITPKMNKLVCSRTLKDEKTKFIDVLYSNDIEIPNLSQYTNMRDCETIYAGGTNTRFQKKDLKPLIAANDKYNSDILIATVNLKGQILKDIANTKAAVLSYMIAKGELTFIVSLRDFGEGCKFEFTCHNYTLLQETTYTFTKEDDGQYHVSVVVNDNVPEAINKPTYKIKRFRPNKPTHLVFVIDIDKNDFLNTRINTEYHTVVYVNSLSELEDNVEKYYGEGYRAATLFVNDDNVDREDEAFKMVSNKFKMTNVLLNTGKLAFIR